jgi:hypothetical protein
VPALETREGLAANLGIRHRVLPLEGVLDNDPHAIEDLR